MMHNKRSAGFSLLELLAVIAIVAILSGLIVPMLGSTAAREASAAASRMVLLINQAREEAVMSARIWRVQLDPVAHSYRFLQLVGGEFADVSIKPFAGRHHVPEVTLAGLEINGQSLAEAGDVYLFPTGEQDTFRLIVRGDRNEYRIAMGPVGEAELEKL